MQKVIEKRELNYGFIDRWFHLGQGDFGDHVISRVLSWKMNCKL